MREGRATVLSDGRGDRPVAAEPTVAVRPSRAARLWALAAVAFLLVLYLGRLGGYPLQDPDEGRYAEIPREMVESGEWLTPRLNYVKYYEKPPLFYWLVALSFTAFGTEEWAGRLVPALAGLVTIALTFALGRSALGSRAAWLGAAVLATSPIFFGLSQAIVIDMVLTACTTATLAAFWFAHRAASRRAKDRWVLVVAVSAALGVLAKGLVALVLPGAIALLCLLLWRDFATLRALVAWRPIVLFLGIAAPWFILVSRAHPEFAYFLFVREHFERFTASVGHPEGPFYYLPVLLVGPLPWSIWAIWLALERVGREAFGRIPREPRSFLAIWAGVVLLFFTAASSKLAPYILPAFPAMALLMGAWLDALLERDELLVTRVSGVTGWSLGALGVALVVAAAVAGLAAPAISSGFHVPEDHVISVVRAFLALGGVLVATLVLLRRGESRQGAVAVAVIAAGLATALLAAIEGRAVVKTARNLGEAVAEHRREGDLVASYRHLMQSLSFYAESRVVQVEAENEIAHGAEHVSDAERAEWFWSGIDRLVREWHSPRRVFVATSRRKVRDLVPWLDPAPRLLARDADRILIVNFPAPGSEPLATAIAPFPREG